MSGKRGRPSIKSKDRTAKIMDLAREGKTDREISEIVGIGERTLRLWKVTDWEFAAALKENKMIADDLVESSLFSTATGYNYIEEAVTKDGIVEVSRHQPANPTAQIFWLKNRKSKEWRDRQEIEHNVVRTVEFESSTGLTKV